jgi:NAD(P)-dependent dehydrogenase (short-subunit alcohol dehydrogenase family)
MPGGDDLVLAGRRAVVTGAGRGIGRAIALALARAGADVGVTARTPGDLELLVADIQGMNNAGTAESHKFLDHPDELWHRMLEANLTSVYYVTKAFVPRLVEQRSGRIINIASIAARAGDRYVAAYTAAKHGVLGLTRALAAELVQYDITVNAICPGYVDTPMTGRSIGNISARTGMPQEEARQVLEKMSPQRRLIEPEEVAAVAVFLAQDLSKGITGQAINVDGGGVMS